MPTCSECKRTIPKARLEASPRSKTCSPLHSYHRKLRRMRENAHKYRKETKG